MNYDKEECENKTCCIAAANCVIKSSKSSVAVVVILFFFLFCPCCVTFFTVTRNPQICCNDILHSEQSSTFVCFSSALFFPLLFTKSNNQEQLERRHF